MTSTNVIRLLCAISLLLGGVAGVAPLKAQYHFESLLDQTPWLSSQNASGLCDLPDSLRQNYAEFLAQKDNGGWRDYNASSDSYEMAVQTASYFLVNSQLALHGEVGYRSFTGKEMTGSVWLHPGDQPFDIVELDPAHAGTKTLEEYHLLGALGYEFGRARIGASFDYTAANQAKRRDLRSQNKYMDLAAELGTSYSVLDDRLELGVSYKYRRSTEELLFKTYGTTGTLYASLIDYGASFGLLEYSQANGLTDENEERPMVTNRHALSLQIALKMARWQWLNEFTVERRDGYYGKSSLYTPVFMEHDALSFCYDGHLAMGGRHAVQYSIGYSQLQNYQNIFSLINQGGGLNEYLYYGQLKTRSQQSLMANLSYHLKWNDWYHQASFSYAERCLTASLYPVYRQHDLHYGTVALSTRREWLTGKHDWSVQLELQHQVGSGTMAKDGEYATAGVIEGTASVVTFDTALLQQYDYLTSPQSGISASLHYGRRLSPALRLYALLSAHFQRAWSASSAIEKHRESISCSLGCTF